MTQVGSTLIRDEEVPLLRGGHPGRGHRLQHCGRDLNPRPAVSLKTKGRLLLVGILGAVFVVFVVAIVIEQNTNLRDRSGKCLLHARATVVTHDMPIGQALNWNSDVLAIRNLDGIAWDDLNVTIYGFVTTSGSTRPTGAHRLRNGADINQTRGDLAAVNLGDFEKPSGERWVSLTMTVADIELKARLRGEACAAEIAPNASVLDVIGR